MESKTHLLQQLSKVEKIAQTSKIQRCLSNPSVYITAILHRHMLYKCTKKPLYKTAHTFFNKTMQVALPAATDIYLTGGKSHNSEIRLAKFLIQQLASENTFWDIGAHFGYFALLAATIVGENGKIIAIEAAPDNYELLKRNTQAYQNIKTIDAAISNTDGAITFYTFPTLYSEYNSFDINQYLDKNWFKKVSYKTINIPTYTLDTLLHKYNSIPNIVKIDVEGAEHLVLEGGQILLNQYQPTIIMEYIVDDNKNKFKAINILKENNYQAHIINNDGSITLINDIEQYCITNKRDSENIVFKKYSKA